VGATRVATEGADPHGAALVLRAGASPPTEASPAGDRSRFERCRRAFSGDRCALLYRRWRQAGEHVLASASSAVVGKAMESGAGKIEPLVLTHGYSHLAPMAGVARWHLPSADSSRSKARPALLCATEIVLVIRSSPPPSPSSSVPVRKQPNSSFSSKTTSSTAYGGPFRKEQHQREPAPILLDV
jgi:hypothetical protein